MYGVGFLCAYQSKFTRFGCWLTLCLRGARGHELDGAVHVSGVSWLFGFQVG